MTTKTTPSAIEILADTRFRDAAEAGAAVIALDEGLNAVLLTDEAGKEIVGARDAVSSPALRQIRSAARLLKQEGSARLLLRQSSRTGTRMLQAELALRPAEGARAPYALLTIAAIGRPLHAADLAEAAKVDGAEAAVFTGGIERFAAPAFAERSPSDLAVRIARFEESAEQIATEETGTVKLTLVRAPFGQIVVLAERVEDHAVEPIEEPLPVAPAPSDAPTGFATFSVKRAKIGEPRPGMSMSALLQRWHSRGPETVSDGETEAELTDGTANDPAKAASQAENLDEPDFVASTEMLDRPVAPSDEMTDETDPGLDARKPETAAAEAVPPVADALTEEPATEVENSGEAVLAQNEAPFGDRRTAGGDEAMATDDEDDDEPSIDPAGTGRPGDDDSAPHAGVQTAAVRETDDAAAQTNRPAFVPHFDVPPVRFVWQIDRDGAFRFLSPDFAGAVGPNAADVVGRSFATVARVFGFDETREIARLLERRDTWSGRTILWPVENSDRKVPVDLAALPVYGRDRSFDGFRGFGIVRLNEAVPDEEGLGRLLTQGAAPEGEDTAQTDLGPDAAGETDGEPPREKPFLRRFEAEGFGRRVEPPAAAEPDGYDEMPKVIRLEERRRPRDGGLSTTEEAAFRAIGAKLGHQAEAETPGALRFEEPSAHAAEPENDDRSIRADAPAEATVPAKAYDAEGIFTRPSETAKAKIETAPDPESSPLEPALEALSEKLARAEAEADRRLAARRKARAAGLPLTPQMEEAQPEASEGEEPKASLAEPLPDATVAPAIETNDETALADSQDLPGDAHPDVASAQNAQDTETDHATAPADGQPVAEAFEEPLSILPPEAPKTVEPGPIEADVSLDAAEEEAEEPPLDIGVFERLFSGLPLAVLVQVRENTVYVNAEFAALTGHDDAAAVEAAGGLDALVLDRQGEGTLALVRADGEIVEVHAHMQRIAEGGRSALLMSFSRVADEEAVAGPALDDLRQEVEELQAVLDTATDGVVLLDMAGSIRAMNGSAHALFGIGADEAFGRHLSSLFAHESQKATVDYLEMLRDDGIGGILNDGREVIGRVSQGGFIPLFITIGRLGDERGWCVVIRDIAHWKRIEEDLVNARRQAEAASLHKSRFLANISHELRTPLNAIIGFADVMSSECFGPIGNERYLEYLGDIKRSGHHVLDLVNDLLDISKIEAGKIDLSFEAVSLNEVVSEAVSLMQPQANRERVIVRSNLPSSVPPVVADRRTMRQIALNLLANAIRFTPAGGQIIASTTYSAEGDVLLRFRDSGIGMTEREIELALTPFQQVHAPSANRGEGTGLGLPLTKAMVEANRAYFSIQSTPGEGTLVEIVFPAPRVLAD